MTRDIVSRTLFEKIVSHPKIKPMQEQSVRDAISRIHKKNHGITMNAAAYVFAEGKGFGVYRYLSSDDKLSLQYLKSPNPTEPNSTRIRKRSIATRDIKVDFESPFIGEANDNARAYPYIYILENTLRSVILKEFEGKPDWWNDQTLVSKDIRAYAEKIREAEKKFPWMKERGNHPIYYVGLFELFKVIERNWKAHFEKAFANLDLEQLRAWIKESVPIRNYVAHNIGTRPQERVLIEKNTDYICRVVGKWFKAKEESRPAS